MENLHIVGIPLSRHVPPAVGLERTPHGPGKMEQEESLTDRQVGQRRCRCPGRRGKNAWLCFVVITAVLLFSGCIDGKPEVRRVGILCGLDIFFSTVDGFKAGMKELGYVEGTTLVYDIQRTNFDLAAQERILRKFVADKVDLMVVFPSEVAVAAKGVTRGTQIPVVFCQTNIEGTNLIKSVPEPGGNITGVRYPGPDLALKRFEILHELVPQAKVFWVPYARNAEIVPAQLAVLRPAAAKAGVTLVESPADSASDLIEYLEARDKARDIGIDAVLFISEPLARTPVVFKVIGKFASEHHIPIGGVLYSLEEYSTLFGVATENLAVGRLAAQQAHKVLRGMPAGTVPVVSAESFFQLNYKVARQLGLSVPEGLLKQADEVIR
jgi:putative tryptophan/tyrosine transport system substrate-binding protein